MNEINRIRGYLTRENTAQGMTHQNSPIKYFVISPERKLYTSYNLALIQFLIRSSETIGQFLEKCGKFLKALSFEEVMSTSQVKHYSQPENLHFYNSKYFKISLRVKVDPKPADEPEMTINQVSQIALDQKDLEVFVMFPFDDDFAESIQNFFAKYNEFANDKKRVEEFLSTKLEFGAEESEPVILNSINSKKHAETYKTKMRLLIQKMEKDRQEIEAGINPQPRELVPDGEATDSKNSSRLVMLSNGSKYVGPLVNNRPNGSGKEFLPDGVSYVGEFKNGFWHGSGYLVDSNNFTCYGEFFEDRVVGI